MIDLIKAAILTNNPELQKTAENAILKLRLEQTQHFFIENVNILQNLHMPIAIRQAAGTLLIASIKFKSNETFLWDGLTPAAKPSFKSIVLGCMIDKEKIIRRAAANIVAAICCIEIPRKQWEGIAQTITANMTNSDIIVKQVSILTIGFICQQLKQFNFEFQQPLQQTILTGILLGLKETQTQIVETAFKALRDGIPSVTALMKNQKYREYLITQIAQAFKSKQFLQYGLQCLTEFIKYHFSHMEIKYVEWLAPLVDPFLRNPKEESSCILAMDFWSTFAKQEKNIEKNPAQKKFILGVLADRLVEALLQNLCEVQKGQQQGNGISDAAENTLQSIFQDNSTAFQAKVLTFTENTINHSNWKYRQGSIRAFANLLIGLPEQVSQGLVNSSLLTLVALLNDSSPHVQASAIRSLHLISQYAGKAIINHPNFINILQLITKKAQENQLNMLHSCKIIDQLCQVPQSRIFFISICDQLITFLLKSCLQKNRSISSSSNCMCSILSLVTNSQSIVIANKYIDYVLNNFSQILILSHQKESFYTGFYTLAQICLITARKAKGSITINQMSRLYELVTSYFTKLNNVQGDGFYVVSALTFFIPQDTRIVDDFWKYVEFGLKKTNQSDVFKAVISCICDFAANYKDNIGDKVDFTFTQLLDIFENNKVMRQLKIDILMCFGQLFLHCGNTSAKHIKKVMSIMLISIDAVFHIPDAYYSQALQQSIIETLMCIYHGVKYNPTLAQYIPYIHKFISMTTDKSRRPKLEYVKQSMVLLADIAYMYQMQSHKIVDRNFILDRIQIMNRFNTNGILNNEISYIKKQFGIKA